METNSVQGIWNKNALTNSKKQLNASHDYLSRYELKWFERKVEYGKSFVRSSGSLKSSNFLPTGSLKTFNNFYPRSIGRKDLRSRSINFEGKYTLINSLDGFISTEELPYTSLQQKIKPKLQFNLKMPDLNQVSIRLYSFKLFNEL